MDRKIVRDFDMLFEGVSMRAYTETIDGQEVKFIGGTASSTAKDLYESIIGASCQVKMLNKLRGLAAGMAGQRSGLTAWLNHSYKIPEDTLGAFVGAALTTRSEGGDDFIDLDIKCRVTETNPRAVAAWQQVADGIRHGWSIGAIFTEAHYLSDDPADGDAFWTLIVDDIDLLEVSLVGIPANQRAWCRGEQDLKDMVVMKAEEIALEARDNPVGVAKRLASTRGLTGAFDRGELRPTITRDLALRSILSHDDGVADSTSTSPIVPRDITASDLGGETATLDNVPAREGEPEVTVVEGAEAQALAAGDPQLVIPVTADAPVVDEPKGVELKGEGDEAITRCEHETTCADYDAHVALCYAAAAPPTPPATATDATLGALAPTIVANGANAEAALDAPVTEDRPVLMTAAGIATMFPNAPLEGATAARAAAEVEQRIVDATAATQGLEITPPATADAPIIITPSPNVQDHTAAAPATEEPVAAPMTRQTIVLTLEDGTTADQAQEILGLVARSCANQPWKADAEVVEATNAGAPADGPQLEVNLAPIEIAEELRAVDVPAAAREAIDRAALSIELLSKMLATATAIVEKRDAMDGDVPMVGLSVAKAIGHAARAVGHGLCIRSAGHVGKAIDCLSAVVGNVVDQPGPSGDTDPDEALSALAASTIEKLSPGEDDVLVIRIPENVEAADASAFLGTMNERGVKAIAIRAGTEVTLDATISEKVKALEETDSLVVAATNALDVARTELTEVEGSLSVKTAELEGIEQRIKDRGEMVLARGSKPLSQEIAERTRTTERPENYYKSPAEQREAMARFLETGASGDGDPTASGRDFAAQGVPAPA